MIQEKKKRFVRRIGDLFCAEIDNEYKVYFQYVAKDTSNLYSTVIRVFKTRYNLDDNPTTEDIVHDEVLFYVHALLIDGVESGAWRKVGTSKELGLEELQKVWWGTTYYFDTKFNNNKIIETYVDPADNWKIWQINKPWVYVGRLSQRQKEEVHVSAIFPFISIIEMIKNGRLTTCVEDENQKREAGERLMEKIEMRKKAYMDKKGK